jgi:hypothetical protein
MKSHFAVQNLDSLVRGKLNVVAAMSEFAGISFQLQQFSGFPEKLTSIARSLA